MILFPPSKINLGLYITRKREDGYHDLQTVFYPLAIEDALEALPSSEFRFTTSGLSVEGPEEKNLCVRAYHLLKQDFVDLPPVHIHLHKAIPMGAGLGGGSSDGAYTLRLLNALFRLELTTEQLIGHALALGSDCPFFIEAAPAYALSRGEILEPCKVDLSNFHILVVNPGIHVSTNWAFSQLTPQQPATNLKESILQPVDTWKENITNDFEAAVFRAHPEIAQIKSNLYQSGAVYASMTGSGSTVYGIFSELPNKEVMDGFKSKGYGVWSLMG